MTVKNNEIMQRSSDLDMLKERYSYVMRKVEDNDRPNHSRERSGRYH